VQVLGATNYTHWKDAHQVRECSGPGRPNQELQAEAIARLDTFAHVGIMEDLDGSILSLAASMGLKLDGPAWKVRFAFCANIGARPISVCSWIIRLCT